MKVEFSVVPPGGGEADYVFDAEMDALPNTGDYVFRRDPNASQESVSAACPWSAFIVRRRWFWPGEAKGSIMVEVEVARYYRESDTHKRTCEMYAARGNPPQELQ